PSLPPNLLFLAVNAVRVFATALSRGSRTRQGLLSAVLRLQKLPSQHCSAHFDVVDGAID
nr:hypothetical protein [Gammaproteobacteria bacterium]